MTNWKTTGLGVAGVLGALSAAMTALFDGDVSTVVDWPSTITQITLGLGLIFAKDASAKKTE